MQVFLIQLGSILSESVESSNCPETIRHDNGKHTRRCGAFRKYNRHINLLVETDLLDGVLLPLTVPRSGNPGRSRGGSPTSFLVRTNSSTHEANGIILFRGRANLDFGGTVEESFPKRRQFQQPRLPFWSPDWADKLRSVPAHQRFMDSYSNGRHQGYHTYTRTCGMFDRNNSSAHLPQGAPTMNTGLLKLKSSSNLANTIA